MSRFLVSFLYIILCIDSISSVRILGLFPQHRDILVRYSKFKPGNHWMFQSLAMFRAAITLADRYKIYVHNHPINYTLIQTNSDDDGFAELNLVCRAITNKMESDVVGIVGPMSSTVARFLGPFAAHVGLPVVSYGATNAELDDRLTYQTFYRTIPSDILLAEAIAQLFQYFSWTTCTIILGKDDYGYGGLKLLSEVYHSNLSIEERVIFDPQQDKFHADLKKILERSRSRIVLVWANQNSSSRIIQHALQAHLLGGSYVWLMTNKIDFSIFETKYWSELEGILAVVPIIGNGSIFNINEKLKNEAFDIWRHSSYHTDHFPEDLSDLSPFAMYTFDAVWSLIQALNKSTFDNESPLMEESSQCFESLLINDSQYHMHLKNTHFLGVSGMVEFAKNNSNNRLNGGFYALYNVQWLRRKGGVRKQEPKYEQIMTWHETNRQWTICSDKDKLNIVWPDAKTQNVPTDYPQLEGKYLRILVIAAPPFVIVRNVSTHSPIWHTTNSVAHDLSRFEPLHTISSDIVIYGLVADFIRELQTHIHFNYTINVADPSTNYHSLVALLANDHRQYDFIVSDIRITSSRLLTVDFSTPFHENTFRIITRVNPYSSFSLFSCFNPFTWDVWAAICALIIYSGVMIYLFERRNLKLEHDESGVKTIFIGVCQVLSSMIIMNTDVRLTTNASRLTIIGLYALGIILVATYTANLSSFLTLNRAQPYISGIDDIKNGRLPFSRIGIVSNSAVSDYYIQNISLVYYSLATAEEIYMRLLDHTIDAAIWDSSVLEYAVNNYYCDQLAVVGVGFVKSSFAVVLPKDWLYKRDLDVHILAIRESEKLDDLEKFWFEDRRCSSTSIDKNNDSNIKIFSLDAMCGLFLSFLILTAVSFGIHLWHCRSAIVTIICQMTKRLISLIRRIIKKR